MATAAVASPAHAFSHPEPAQGLTADSRSNCGYTDPTRAPKTKASPHPNGLKPQPAGPNQLYKQKCTPYGDWRDDLMRDGYVVVKGVIPKERALAYAEETFNYLETL